VSRSRSRISAYAELLRIRHWSKNVFVVFGLIFSKQLFHLDTALRSVATVGAFCLAASAVYCVNDILDREADALHPEKSHRPLPTGKISVRSAATLTVALALAAAVVIVAARLPWPVAVVVGSYVVMNVAYSAWLKHFSIVDVVVIAAGFELRLLAGTYAVNAVPSSWIVLCTGLLALFLALGKRRGDLERELHSGRRSLSGYTLNYIDQALGMFGAATIVFYTSFTVSSYARGRFHSTYLYLTAFPVAIAFLRYLQLLLVKNKYGSPTDIAFRDRPLQVLGIVWLTMFGIFVYA
jgi:4-hydroxybenzoate polyprenyltransferase